MARLPSVYQSPKMREWIAYAAAVGCYLAMLATLILAGPVLLAWGFGILAVAALVWRR